MTRTTKPTATPYCPTCGTDEERADNLAREYDDLKEKADGLRSVIGEGIPYCPPEVADRLVEAMDAFDALDEGEER